MKQIRYILKRYFLLLLALARNSLAGQLEYRVNFFSGLFVETGFMLAKLTYVVLIYSADVSINGMSPDYILIFIGTYAIMTGIYMSFAPSIYSIPGYIKEGTLDIYLTKPVSSLFLVSARYIDFAMPIPNLVGGIIMVVIGWEKCAIPATIRNILAFLIFVLLGAVSTFAIFLLIRLSAFWLVSINGIVQISDSIWDFNNMPMGIYNRAIQGIGCFLFPIFLITNMPGLVIGGRVSGWFVVWAVVVPFIEMAVTIMVWRIALRKYSSASS